MKENWKSVEGYEGLYEVSNEGRVRSLDREVVYKDGRVRKLKGRILKPVTDSDGYYNVRLSKNNKRKSKKVHQLVAMAFLGHTPCGMKLVVNHKDFNKLNNNVDNLEIVTARENTNKKHIKSSSKYTGVCWRKDTNKWRSDIVINGKRKYLGCFTDEYDAHLAYQKALKEINLK